MVVSMFGVFEVAKKYDLELIILPFLNIYLCIYTHKLDAQSYL